MRTGASCSDFAPGFLRWMRVCNAANGSGAIAVAPGEQFAVDHGIATQTRCGAFDFRETSVETFLAARPQRNAIAAPDQLQTNAVPFPFENPVGDVAERFRHRRVARREKTETVATRLRR